jgi:YggT family protein
MAVQKPERRQAAGADKFLGHAQKGIHSALHRSSTACPPGALASSATLRQGLLLCRVGITSARTLCAECRMTSLYQILMLLLDIAQFIILAHIIMSWLINFQVLNLRQSLVAQLWGGLSALLDPIYNRVRRFLPQMGGLDLAPLVVLIAVYALRIILQNNVAAFV